MWIPDVGMILGRGEDRTMIPCHYCKAESTEAHALRVIYNHSALHAEWAGWRMAGRWLVSPKGDRITPDELARVLAERRLRAVSRTGVTAVGIPGARGAGAPEPVRRERSARGDAPPPQYAPKASLP